MKIYLIQGFSMPSHQWYNIGCDSRGYMSVFVQQGLSYFMFSGGMYPDETSDAGYLAGQMVDQIGDSRLSKGQVLMDRAEFTKEYLRIPGEIRYELKKQEGGIWVGRHTSEIFGEGSVRCVITEVSEEIFHPPNLPDRPR